MAIVVEKAPVQESNAAPWGMPPVWPGDVVMWSQNPHSESAPAIVTRIGKNAISLYILPPESRVGIPRDGVRHVDDPDLLKMNSDAGVWRQSYQMLRMQALEAIIEARRGRAPSGSSA